MVGPGRGAREDQIRSQMDTTQVQGATRAKTKETVVIKKEKAHTRVIERLVHPTTMEEPTQARTETIIAKTFQVKAIHHELMTTDSRNHIMTTKTNQVATRRAATVEEVKTHTTETRASLEVVDMDAKTLAIDRLRV